jgi:hypothetical protein
MGLPWESRWKMNANYINLFFLSPNPLINLLPNRILAFLHIQLFIKHMLICLQKIKIPTAIFANAIVAFFQPTCFHNKSNLGTKSLSWPSMTMHTLHLTYVTFPSTPTIDFAQGNFATHESWKR